MSDDFDELLRKSGDDGAFATVFSNAGRRRDTDIDVEEKSLLEAWSQECAKRNESELLLERAAEMFQRQLRNRELDYRRRKQILQLYRAILDYQKS